MFANIQVNETTGCWFWCGRKTGMGYGQVKQKGRGVLVHRIMARHAIGPIEGLDVLHRCDTPLCCNPRHLFLGTAKDNAQDSVAKGRHVNTRKTVCKHGHPFSAENTYILTRSNGKRERRCRACRLKLFELAGE